MSTSKRKRTPRLWAICKSIFTKVNGYMLYDKGKLHQAITNEVIDLMNKADFSDASAFTITYGKIEYKVLDRTIEVLINKRF